MRMKNGVNSTWLSLFHLDFINPYMVRLVNREGVICANVTGARTPTPRLYINLANLKI